MVALFGLVRSPWALLVPVPLLLMAAVFANISLIWTGFAPNYDSYGYFLTLLISPMFLFAGIFFPLEGLPPLYQALAWFTPLYHAVEVIRPLVTGQPPAECLTHIIWLFVAFFLTIRWPLVMLKNRLTS